MKKVVFEWFKRFKVKCKGSEDDPRTAQLLTAQELVTNAKVHELAAREYQMTLKLMKD